MKLELRELQMRYQALRAPDAGRDAQLMASLAAHGQQSPLGVVRAQGSAAYVLIDGYRRVRALSLLAEDLVDVAVLDLPEVEALIHAHRMDADAPRTALEDGWLLMELMEQHGFDQQQLAVRLDRSRSWVCRRLALVTELPEVVQEAVRHGMVPAYAAQKFLVPLARANRGHASTLVTNLGAPAVTVREVERLYHGYKLAEAEGRKRIVKEPRLFLLAEAATREPEGSPTQRFVTDMQTLSSVCWRATRRLREGQVQRESRRVQRCMREARQAFAALAAQYDEETEHAGCADPRRHSSSATTGTRSAHHRQGGGRQQELRQEGPA